MNLRTKIVLSDSSHLLLRTFRWSDIFTLKSMYNALSGQTKELFHPTFLQTGPNLAWFRDEALLVLSGNNFFSTMLIRIFPRAVYLTLLVLNSEQEIVALSFYKIRRKLGKGQLEAENGIVVREDYQGRGLGFKLFILGNRFAKLYHVRKIYSLVNSENRRMINLNRKLGFKINRKVAMKNLRSGESYQAFEMSLSIA